MDPDKIKRLYVCDQPHDNWYEHIITPHYSKSPHNSKHLIDAYSLTHVFWPMLLTFVLRKMFNNHPSIPIIVFGICFIFEIIENQKDSIIKYRRIEIDSNGSTSYRGDSMLNIVGDLMFNVAGIYLAMNIESDQIIVFVIVMLFFMIVQIVGMQYWVDFLNFIKY